MLREKEKEDGGFGICDFNIPNCFVRLYFSDKQIDLNEAMEAHMLNIIGSMDYNGQEVGYSEFSIEGFETNSFTVGNHDLFDILSSLHGKYVHILIDIDRKINDMIIKDFIIEDFRNINVSSDDLESAVILETYKETVFQSIERHQSEINRKEEDPLSKIGWEGYNNNIYSPHTPFQPNKKDLCGHSIISVSLHDDYISADIQIFDNEEGKIIKAAYEQNKLVFIPSFKLYAKHNGSILDIECYNYCINELSQIEKEVCSLNYFSLCIHRISEELDIDITSEEGYEKIKLMMHEVNKYEKCNAQIAMADIECNGDIII